MMDKTPQGKLTILAAYLLLGNIGLPSEDEDDYKTKTMSIRKVCKFSSDVRENLRQIAIKLIAISESIDQNK